MSNSISSSSTNSSLSTNTSTSSTSDSKSSDDSSAADADGAAQPDGLLLQQGQLFRSLMTGDQATDQQGALPGHGLVPAREQAEWGFGSGLGAALDDTLHRNDVDIAAQLLAQRLLDAGPMLQAAVSAGAAPDMTFAELMEKHIKRALVSAGVTDDSEGGEIRLELSDAILPSTTLSLRRTADGWELHAVTANSQSRQALARFAPSLVARFAQSALGQLQVSLDGT
jgi:Type III secretion protein (HpaP)